MAARVLVADDARFMRQMMREILEPEGFAVVGEAVDGREVVEYYARLKPDVVAVDVVMPERSGVAVAREILAFDPGARIVMMGAVGQEALVQRALEVGAADAVAKPFKPSAVIETLRRLLARRKARLVTPGAFGLPAILTPRRHPEPRRRDPARGADAGCQSWNAARDRS